MQDYTPQEALLSKNCTFTGPALMDPVAISIFSQELCHNELGLCLLLIFFDLDTRDTFQLFQRLSSLTQ